MTAKVECYAGSTYPEHPRALTWENQRYQVCDIIQRRREPDGVGFLVRCAPDDMLFNLFYLTKEEHWQIQPIGSAYSNQKDPQIQGN